MVLSGPGEEFVPPTHLFALGDDEIRAPMSNVVLFTIIDTSAQMNRPNLS